ncbi:carbohydrate kinase family protein [Geomesophilobacter sediminis]|uniref:Carbohydrate kinase n=1 Tax=Geomesophilobacter sediminis TaxID=2798584 RepID=A0A8J7S9W3_9BACT|nr:PfkB family carbohydrate kinase [Geomesophilobacter sediminis]MBJ6727105.1 carbohydrate kinase [Geomesophilobacter sediminis]
MTGNAAKPIASQVAYDVIGLGVSTLDLLMVVDELPGAELVQQARASLLQGGGPVATAMVTLARLGARIAMIDRLGDDWRGNLILDEFQREGVDTRHISREPGGTSSIATILVRRRDGARTIVYQPGDAGAVDPALLPEPAIRSTGILHLNGRHLQACLQAARLARRQGVLVSFDGGAHRYTPELVPLLENTDLCIVARQFASAFSGEAAIDRCAESLLKTGPRIVVITAGADGSWVRTREGDSFHQPAMLTKKTVDTTGAGDAYHGGFLYGISRNYPLKECALLASAVAALNTGALGGRSALPSLDQARQFLRERGFTSRLHDHGNYILT